MNRVNEVTKDTFNALIQLRSVPRDASIQPEHLHQRLKAFIDEAIQRGKTTGITESDLADITYAMCASADEFAQRKPGPLREFWLQRPLQLHYFGENIAGEHFFRRLDAILSDPARVEALAVYHMCLQFGFEGRYAVRGGELELDVVRRRVREGLGRLLRAEPISRRHLPKREALQGRSLNFFALWVGMFAILFALCFLIVLRIALDGMSGNLNDRTQQLLDGFAGGAPQTENT